MRATSRITSRASGLVGRGEDRDAGFDDAGLFGGDLCPGMAEPLLVIELDIGDDAGERRDDVGGVEPATHAGFPNHQFTALFDEILERQYHDDLEKGRMPIRRKMGEPIPGAFDEADDVVPGDELSVDLDAFAEADQVRRGEQTGAQSGGAVNGLEHGAGRTFAVGAGHVDEPELAVGMAGEFGQAQGVLESQFQAEQPQAVEEFDGLGVSHREARRWPRDQLLSGF